MDTSNNLPIFILPDGLAARMGYVNAPLLLDIWCEAKFLKSPRMPLRDVLFACCLRATGEPHSWKSESMTAAAAA